MCRLFYFSFIKPNFQENPLRFNSPRFHFSCFVFVFNIYDSQLYLIMNFFWSISILLFISTFKYLSADLGIFLEFTNMSNSRQKIIYFEEGWNFVQKGIKKLQNNLEGLPGPSLTSVDHTLLYTYVSIPDNNLEPRIWNLKYRYRLRIRIHTYPS